MWGAQEAVSWLERGSRTNGEGSIDPHGPRARSGVSGRKDRRPGPGAGAGGRRLHARPPTPLLRRSHSRPGLGRRAAWDPAPPSRAPPGVLDAPELSGAWGCRGAVPEVLLRSPRQAQKRRASGWRHLRHLSGTWTHQLPRQLSWDTGHTRPHPAGPPLGLRWMVLPHRQPDQC